MRFNFEFIIALLCSLLAVYSVNKSSPELSPYVTFLLLPFLISYLVISIINNLFPWLNNFGYNIYQYTTDKSLATINDTNYMQIYPTILLVLIIFVLLLYNGILN